MSSRAYGGQSMTAPLRRVLVASPVSAGWSDPARAERWRELGYAHPPDGAEAVRQHDALKAILLAAGAEVIELPGADGLSLDSVYVHDASIMTDHGAICLRMGKIQRALEPDGHLAFYESAGIPVLGEISAPGIAEAGDLLWLDEKTLLAGRGYRTNAAGIEQLRALLAPKGIEVLPAPLPHGGGPTVCLHLMSLMSVVDEGVALVDASLVAVETLELLQRLDFTLVGIDPAERATQAANVLALGGGRLAAIEENIRTNERLREAGFDVRTFPGGEICQNGGGGPTCLTRAIQRA